MGRCAWPTPANASRVNRWGSAARIAGECAQACRMPYELIVDGALRDLGDRRYLLSPQDLAAVGEIPALIEQGVVSFKIEGRLKSPEYVAAICQVYRKAIDAAMGEDGRGRRRRRTIPAGDGVLAGVIFGVDARGESPGTGAGAVREEAGSVRGACGGCGERSCDAGDAGRAELKRETGWFLTRAGDTDHEQGGRVYRVEGKRVYFGRGQVGSGRCARGTGCGRRMIRS